jgi:hypothetical protein
MADDFIDSLKRDWEGQAVEATLARLRRRRWLPPVLMSLDVLGAAVMAVAGAGFAMVALRLGDLLFGLSAVAMLLVGLPLVLAAVRVRWRSLAWHGETAEGVLTCTLRRLRATERSLRLGRGGACVLFALAAVVLASRLAGLVHEPWSILLIITAAWTFSGLLMFAWVGWRLGRTARERAGCEALLGQFKELG